MTKRKLSFWQIWNMSFGFLGVQYAFGLQQANMSPVYRYLGADEAHIPYLWLAGPITGLLVQPIVGALSDKTWHPFLGRRRGFILIGAILTSLALVLMPHSRMLWHAAALLWLLDGAANVTMEPFRALIADKLDESQRPLGFSIQSLFVGLGQVLANLMPFILGFLGFLSSPDVSGSDIPLFVRLSFYVGATTILLAVLVTVLSTREEPPSAEELAVPKKAGLASAFGDVVTAIREMPAGMKQLWWVKFFTWMALPLMWQYYGLAISRHAFGAAEAGMPGFDEGIKYGNLGFGVFSASCFLFSLTLPYVARKLGRRSTHALLLITGALGFGGMWFAESAYTFVALMLPVGIAWSSIMAMPYVMLAAAVPEDRMGVYMGIFNMFIVIPQIMSMLLIPQIYEPVLAGDPRNTLLLAAILLVFAALANRWVKLPKPVAENEA